MNISVVIPVFKAEKFIGKAVESALNQSETYEILLIEDASPDNSLLICQALEKKHDKVKLLRHPDSNNHGAGASRNLGIRTASCDYLAFLDADDFYLPGRFIKAKELFEKYPHIDGVYEATGVYFYDDQSKHKWFTMGGKNIATLKAIVPPNRLFEYLLKGGGDYLHLNGIVIKKELFRKCGFFPEELKLHQDTALIFQMAASGVLFAGNLNSPVAYRSVHDTNRILGNYNKYYTKLLLWKSLFKWARNRKMHHKNRVRLFLKYLYYLLRVLKNKSSSQQTNFFSYGDLFKLIIKHPLLSIESLFLYFLDIAKIHHVLKWDKSSILLIL
jgi:glycosyltransferase involved in cell wall biosynthesis